MPPIEPTAEHLLLQLIRLARAQFDMRCAEALSWDLEKSHEHVGPWAYGLYTGLAICYARPFEAGKRNPYGPLEGKWSKFSDRPDFKKHHKRLIEHRNTLLAHNDLTPHRVSLVWPDFHEGRPAILEGRSPINAVGVTEARELFKFQQDRFGEHAQSLAGRLQEMLGWKSGEELDLDDELRRVRLGA